MEVKELVNDGLTIRLSFHFVKDDYADSRKKALNRFRRNADIKGFRRGMAPMALIERLYGGQALVESVNQLISDSLNNYIEEHKLTVIGEPLPVEDTEAKNDFDGGEEFDFTFDIALAPKFDLTVSAEDKIPYYTIPVNDKEKEEYKKMLFKQYSRLESCPEVKDGDFVIADMTQGERKVEGAYIATSVLSDDAKAQFVGKKTGDVMDVDVVATFPNEADRAAMLRVKKEELASTEPVWHLEVKDVKNYVDAVPGKELYDALFGPDKVHDEAEFDKAVTERMTDEFKQESDYRFMLDAREYLMNKADIKVSEDFLKRWLYQVNEGKFSKEDIDKDFPMFIKDFKWQTVEGRIMADNKLEVTKDDLNAEALKLARYQFAMYGLSNVPEEHLKGYAANIMADDKQGRRIAEKAQENVVLDFVRKTVTLDNKEISSAELRKMNQ
ncbi:MAG TPA: trigger factor family protein [Candidatus Coprenecus pullistercoris]|nr:trigger factor family protein [Candidatus Coprenecus pullistercoris]